MTEIVAITVADPLMAAAFALRRDVFVVEQGIPMTGIAGAIVQSAIGAIIVLTVVGLIKRVAT